MSDSKAHLVMPADRTVLSFKRAWIEAHTGDPGSRFWQGDDSDNLEVGFFDRTDEQIHTYMETTCKRLGWGLALNWVIHRDSNNEVAVVRIQGWSVGVDAAEKAFFAIMWSAARGCSAGIDTQYFSKRLASGIRGTLRAIADRDLKVNTVDGPEEVFLGRVGVTETRHAKWLVSMPAAEVGN